ncbi:protein MpTRIHELIX38 [Marchantia polymorpha subsp. ruderalis]|uniref:Myb-like domain-containing protein n=2 Tax=Marchantia polymorpha TaxID=3197 RepID=A0A176VPK2_MARPO|nr:hypothetical protein AXG93_3988s1110 [Marchantia polymorpha subsp. ruderalis]PTQ27061.1 hypothetical protein MARPO_0229s0008 [Marchantia polymorpha]BBN11797.1 hypothetical protein Mp_5g14820 [Marchantia polymorpha subsp. ruderalis]|eukprot:PTQ27061.1 hypothetical protein MARPO_0229s0008 [Marchantia polymorpha]
MDVNMQAAQEERTNRHPRWDKHETLILVTAKRKQNEGIRDAGMRSRKFGSPDERWDLVSSYCQANGVHRNARECRRQWNNMFHSDYRRIRNWQKLNDVESFWTMSKDQRKEHQLPLTFYREVFAEIESFLGRKPSFSTTSGAAQDFSRPPRDETAVSDDSPSDQNITEPLQSGSCGGEELTTSSGKNGNAHEHAGRNKRKVVVANAGGERDNLKEELASVLESSGRAIQRALSDKIRSQIEADNRNSELDRSQRKEHGDSLIGVLGSLACALGRIADKM